MSAPAPADGAPVAKTTRPAAIELGRKALIFYAIHVRAA
jgi:hypothetical protein